MTGAQLRTGSGLRFCDYLLMCGKSLQESFCSCRLALLRSWLCHADARQVLDLPVLALLFQRVSDPDFFAVEDRRNPLRGWTASRRLAAHQRGRAITRFRVTTQDSFLRSCRASAWQSHNQVPRHDTGLVFETCRASAWQSHNQVPRHNRIVISQA